MNRRISPPLSTVCARQLRACLMTLAALCLALLAPSASAQVTHVTNPFASATMYLNPDYTTEVNAAVATEPSGSTLANQMSVVATYPTFVWMDHIGAIAGGSANSGRLGLAAHITAALAQQKGSTPIVVGLVIYDLPDRDCAALASNGELSIAGGDTPIGSTTPLTGTGLQEYENDYITPIYNILAQYSTNPDIRFVLVIEDDSLPNMVTNTGIGGAAPITNCVSANNGQTYSQGLSMQGVYVEGIQYALNQFHKLPNAYNYLDVGHHGWLGWPANLAAAVPYFYQVASGTTAGVTSVDGFITNTANYGPTKEPYMTATEEVGGSEVYSSSFYQWDPEIDEEDYAAAFDSSLISAGFPSTLGFLIDTSRNGWGSPDRPTAASTSTDLNTFVDATKIDLRDDMGQWCNQSNSGLGVPPTVDPGYFANLQAYVWVKPPGESDGNYPGSVYDGVTSTKGDPNCDPAHDNALANDMATDALANSPSAGTFWTSEFAMLVENADPVVPATTAPGFSISGTGVSVEQGTSATSSITVSAINGFDSAVALTVSGLPTGITAAFSPASVTGSSGSTLTFTATNTATVGAATVTVTGTSGSTTETATLDLTVTAEPNFTISASPAAISLPANSNPTSTISVTFVGGLTGSVGLSATGLPSGVSANFAPSSLNASGTSVVNFTSQANTPAGTTNISIVGTDGSVTHSATIALTVPATGFTLASSSSSVALTQGKTATNTISVADVGSFTGSVTLAASGLPSGVTAAFGTNPTTGSSVVTLTASSTATAGASTVTITGTSGSTTASTTFTLSVSAASSFTLTPSASTLALTQGKTATDTVSVTDVGGFTGSVTLAASGLPSGVTVAYGTNPTTGSSVLTFTATSTATAGTSTVTVTGTSGSVTATTTIALTVSASSSFTLAPSASTLALTRGKTATDTISVTDVGGFTGSVTLATSGLPSGVTVAYGTNPTTGSSVLTFTASSTATTGTSNVTITGTSGSVTATTTIALTVSAASSFTLAPSASTLALTQGKTATDTISVTDVGGFTGSVTLAASGLPSGVTVAYGTNPTTGSSVLTFTATSTATAGTSTVTVTGTSGSVTATTTIALTVSATTTTGAACHVAYTISSQWPGGFGAAITINNTGTTALTNWTLTWTFANGQTVTELWNGVETQSGANVTVNNMSYNGSIPAGGSYNGMGFNGSWNSTTNSVPTSFAVNGVPCN